MDDLFFEDWYQKFVVAVRGKQYNGPIDKESAYVDFQTGATPEDAAAEFVDEMSN